MTTEQTTEATTKTEPETVTLTKKEYEYLIDPGSAQLGGTQGCAVARHEEAARQRTEGGETMTRSDLVRAFARRHHRQVAAHDLGASDIEQAIDHLRKARAAFVEVGRENDAASVLEAIRQVEGLRLEIGSE